MEITMSMNDTTTEEYKGIYEYLNQLSESEFDTNEESPHGSPNLRQRQVSKHASSPTTTLENSRANYASSESSSDDEFLRTRRHFQQWRQISLGNEFRYKMQLEIEKAKKETLLNNVPLVIHLNTDNNKAANFVINSGITPFTQRSQRIYIWNQLVAALGVAIGFLMVGFSCAYTSPAFRTMNDTMTINAYQKSWISGVLPLTALVGSIIGFPSTDMFGRRLTIMATAVSYFLGWILIATAQNVYMVLTGRVVCGIGVGVGSVAFPTYLGETIQPGLKGAFRLLPTTFGSMGILLAFLSGSYLTWSELAFLGAGPPIALFILMTLSPETPRWYITKERSEDARKTLQLLRGKNVKIDNEMSDMVRMESVRAETSGFIVMFSWKYLPALLISLGLMLFQQFSGMTAVVFYANDIIMKSSSTINESISSVIIGIVSVIFTLILTAFIDRLRRKILLCISSVSMIVALVMLGGYFYVLESGSNVTSIRWLPLLCLVIYVFGFSIGFGHIPCLILGEVFPVVIHREAAFLVTVFNWFCTFLVAISFQSVAAAINMSGTVWLFAFICVGGLLFVIFYVPETQGKTLEDLEKKLAFKHSQMKKETQILIPDPQKVKLKNSLRAARIKQSLMEKTKKAQRSCNKTAISERERRRSKRRADRYNINISVLNADR